MVERKARSLEERELRTEGVAEELQAQQKVVVEGVLRASWWYGLEQCAQLARRLMAVLQMVVVVLAVPAQLGVEEVPV